MPSSRIPWACNAMSLAEGLHLGRQHRAHLGGSSINLQHMRGTEPLPSSLRCLLGRITRAASHCKHIDRLPSEGLSTEKVKEHKRRNAQTLLSQAAVSTMAHHECMPLWGSKVPGPQPFWIRMVGNSGSTVHQLPRMKSKSPGPRVSNLEPLHKVQDLVLQAHSRLDTCPLVSALDCPLPLNHPWTTTLLCPS